MEPEGGSGSQSDRDESKNRAPGPEWTYFHGKWMVGGEREVLLVVSLGASASPDAVPHAKAEGISPEDRRKLESQGVPSDCEDDVSIVRARISLDRDYQLSREVSGTAENELTRDHALRELEEFLNQVEKPGGICMYVHVYSP